MSLEAATTPFSRCGKISKMTGKSIVELIKQYPNIRSRLSINDYVNLEKQIMECFNIKVPPTTFKLYLSRAKSSSGKPSSA
jgi:hypothetical protein